MSILNDDWTLFDPNGLIHHVLCNKQYGSLKDCRFCKRATKLYAYDQVMYSLLNIIEKVD